MFICYASLDEKMSVCATEEIESATASDKDKSIKAKHCNKFSIENILGLNDDEKLTRVNRLELMGFSQKGKVDSEGEPFDFD